jgi:TPR repeat protein
MYYGMVRNGKANGIGIFVHPSKCHYIGNYVDDKENGEGKEYFKSGACYSGQFYLGDLHGSGSIVYPNGDKFEGHWEKGVREGNGVLTRAAGKQTLMKYSGGDLVSSQETWKNSGIKKSTSDLSNNREHAELTLKGALGDVEAQLELGFRYMNGDGVEQNDSKCYEWFEKAAFSGNAKGQYQVGVCYTDGRGVDENLEEAIKWFEMSANQGFAMAQYKTAMCYIGGRGTPRDESRGIFWVTKAAEGGNVDAQCFLANCYFSGLGGVRQDYNASYSWYTKAAKQNSGDAYFWLGTILENGYVNAGLPENELWSLVEDCYQTAIRLGCDDGKSGLESLNRRKALKRAFMSARFAEENRGVDDETDQYYGGKLRADAHGSYNLSDEINEDDFDSEDFETDSYEYDEDGNWRIE